MAVRYVSDQNPDGNSFGRDPTDLISFYGEAPMAQPEGDITAALVALGLIKPGATIVAIGLDSAAWTEYEPDVTANTGSLTEADATGHYTTIGSVVFFSVTINIVTNGSGSVAVVVELPINAGNSSICVGADAGVTDKALYASVTGASMQIRFMDGTYPGADGAQLVLSGSYEKAL